MRITPHWKIGVSSESSNTTFNLSIVFLFASCASLASAAQPATQPAPIHIDCTNPSAKSVIWRSHVGARTGMIALHGDYLVVGSNSNAPPQVVHPDEAVVVCLSATDGALRWRITHSRLVDRVNDLPGSPISSHPAFDNGCLYYVSNRGELCCVRISDGERRWSINMPASMGIFKRDPNDIQVLMPSPIVVGDIVYCITGNGRDDLSNPVPQPEAPSFIAVDKTRGTIIWTSNAPGPNIIYGQWSTPARASDHAQDQILFPGGDGLLYSFHPKDGRLLWRIDCKVTKSDARSFIVAPPLVDGDTVYVSLNRDYEQGFGIPHSLLAISISQRRIVWLFQGKPFDGTFGAMAVDTTNLYVAGFGGAVTALNKSSGKKVWQVALRNNVTGGVSLKAGTLYVAAGESVCVFDATTGNQIAEYEFEKWQSAPPVVASDRMFVRAEGGVFCVVLSP